MYQSKMLLLASGLAISGIAIYFLIKKQRKSRQSLNAVSPKKCKNIVIEAAQASNEDVESLTKRKPFQQADSHAQETQAEDVLFKNCAETTEVEPHFVEATIGEALGEALNFQQVSPPPLQQETPQRMSSLPISQFQFWLQIGVFLISVIETILVIIFN